MHLLWLLFIFLASSVSGGRVNIHSNVSALLDNLLKGYDESIRPDFGGPPTVVEIDIMVRSMGPISEVDMTYSMDCYFRQSWRDTRLQYSSSSASSTGTLALSISMLKKIWKPDTTIRNGKQSYLHTITTPNKFVRLYPDGRVLYSSRLTIKASCPMDLSDFPMDTQRCPLKLGSFGYTTRDVVYRWNPSRKVDIAPDMKMSQFDLISTPSGNFTDHMKSGEMHQRNPYSAHSILEVSFHLRRHKGYFLLQVYLPAYLLVVVSWVSFWLNRESTSDRVTLGEYSFLEVSFHLQRHMGNFLIQVYGPCTLIVIISWVSFWLNREATADRVSLGITTQFTITLLGLEARADLPKVSYPTALDFFVFLSFAFIFATIIQFAIVHSFTKIGSGEIYFNDSSSENEDESEDEESLSKDKKFVSKRGVIKSQSCQDSSMSVIEIPFNGPPSEPSSSSSRAAFKNSENSNKRSNWRICRKTRGNIRCNDLENINSVSKIDRFARIFFPLSFITINIFYWFFYLNNTSPLV